MRWSVRSAILIGVAVWATSFILPAATAATLRPVVQIRGATVRLSDLFAGLNAGQDCTLGDAPPPGTRLVVGEPQIEAISSQFGVDWEPRGTEQTVTLDRAGRTIGQTTVVSMLEIELAKEYGTTRIVVTLASYQDTTVDLNAKLSVALTTIDKASGQFMAVLDASVDGIETLHSPLSGRIDRLITVPVPTRLIAAGQVIGGQDLSSADVPADRVRGDVLEQSNDGVGLVSVRPLSAGEPILRSDLRRPDIVFRDGPVTMRLAANGIEVEALGQSLEAGTLGDRVRVRNPLSHAILFATVTGENEVRIDPAGMPFVQGRGAAYGPAQFGGPGGPSYTEFAGAAPFDGGER